MHGAILNRSPINDMLPPKNGGTVDRLTTINIPSMAHEPTSIIGAACSIRTAKGNPEHGRRRSKPILGKINMYITLTTENIG